MKRPRLSSIIIYTLSFLTILALVVCTAVYFIVNRLDFDSYRGRIMAELQKGLDRPTSYTSAEITFSHGPAFTFHTLEIKEKDGSANFVTARRIDLRLSLLHLLKKEVVFTDVILTNPAISLIRNSSGSFNFSDLLEEKKDQPVSLDIDNIHISDGQIRITDRAVAPEAFSAAMEKVELSLHHLRKGKKSRFKLTTILATGKVRSPLTVNGTAEIPAAGKKWQDSSIHAKIDATGLEPGYFWPYYGKYLPFRQLSGRFDLNSEFKGKPVDFKSDGKVRISGLRFDYPQVFHSILTPKVVQFSYKMESTPTAIKVKQLDLSVDALKVKGNCNILDIHTKDPRITAHATTSNFQLEDFRGYIPYGIIVNDTADFIEQHIIGGIYRLDEGTLDGRISQILHMELGENYNILHIRGQVRQGVMTFGQKVPTFNNIKGELEMKGKDFILRGMSARFGNSPFTLEGRITDYPLNIPSGYPFTMVMKPQKDEIAWLMGEEQGKNLSFKGDSTLRVKGSGFTSGYTLAGEWDLSPAAYSYNDLLKKPAGRANSIGFQGLVFNKEGMKLSSLRYNLAPLSLSLTAGYRYGDNKSIVADLFTNRFPIQGLAPLVPRLSPRYQATGLVQTALHAEHAPATPDSLNWNGTVTISGGSFKPDGNIRPVTAINGTVAIKEKNLESSRLTARIGDSQISGKGSISNLTTPDIRFSFTSPLFDMNNLGLRSQQGAARIANLAGNVSLKGDNITIASLSGQINNSILALKGSVQELKNPKVDISLHARHLEIEDLLLLGALESQKPGAGQSQQLTLKATVTAESGKAREIPFEKLNGVVMYENRILYLQPVEAIIAGGRLSGTARIDTGAPGPERRLQVGYRLEKASAERFMRAMGFEKQDIKGRLSINGEFTAKGDTIADIKRTSLGSAHLLIEDGSLNRFSTLSKIFSVLNISQLLKLKFPEMVSGGMPFDKITATFAIKDGIASTNDLFVDSEAMNISVIGAMNIPRNEIDATVGVKPLQTIDKVVSSIPIVGWILTGKDKALLTAYFEIKGNLDNPSVNVLPVKAISKGVMGIFRRIFELPARLVTDTGEVLTGK